MESVKKVSEKPIKLENMSDEITYESIRSILHLDNKNNFIKYLNEIFDFFLMKYEIPQSKNVRMPFTVFFEYFSINSFLAKCLFNALCKGNKAGISKTEFINGLLKLYTGSFKETSEMIFSIYDISRKGKVKPSEMKLLLSYLPLKSVTHKEQTKSLKEINLIVEETFKKAPELTYEQFSAAILQKKSDSYLQMLLFFYNKKPFTIFAVNSFKYFKLKNQEILKNIPVSDIQNVKFLPINSDTSFISCESYFNDGENFHEKTNLNSVSATPNVNHIRNAINFNSCPLFKSTNTQDFGKRAIDSPVKSKYSGSPLKAKRSNIGQKVSLFKLDSCDENLEETKIEFEPHFITLHMFILNETNYQYSTEVKYFSVLVNKDLLFFTSEAMNDLKVYINLTKAFLTKGEKKLIYKYSFSTVLISYVKNKTFTLLFENDTIRDAWIKAAKKEIQNEEIEEYYKIDPISLGKGQFGEVKVCTKLSTGEKYAVKIMNKDTNNPDEDYEFILREVELMKIFKHKNVIQLIDLFETKHYIYLIMDYLEGGDLITYLSKPENNNLSEKDAAKIIKTIANGVHYFHKFGLIHRDLKPDNIVLMKPNDISSIKIIDFGVSRTVPFGTTINEPLGTLNYCPPQVVSHKEYSHKMDVWSIGIISYLIITGSLPFDDPDDLKLAKKINIGTIDFSKDCFKNKSKGCINFIDHCLEKQEDRRYSIEEVIQDDWLIKYSM